MSITKPKDDADEHSERKSERHQQQHKYGDAFSRAVRRLYAGSWIQNGLSCLVGFVPLVIGVFMRTEKGVIFGLAFTLTLFIWGIAFVWASELTPTPTTNKPTTTNVSTTNINGDQINVNAPNNSGTVIGKQTNNFGPQPRILSADQKEQLEKALAPFAGSQLNVLEVWNGDGDDVKAYSDQIRQALRECGISPTHTRILNDLGLSSNISVFVKDPANPPPIAIVLMKFFNLPAAKPIGSGNSTLIGDVTLKIAARK